MEELGALLPLSSCNEALLDGSLADEDVKEIYLRIINLSAERAERYAMGDSSVRVEVFEELVKSIYFTLKTGIKALGEAPETALKGDIRKLMDAGTKEIESEVAVGRELLERAEKSMLDIDNVSYQGVIKGIQKFFAGYDYHYFAHKIPGDIDYQLCYPASYNLLGIEFIKEYLRRLIIENEFCGHFDTDSILKLLQNFSPDYKGLLINLFEPVAVNAIGLALLDSDIFELEISVSKCAMLEKNFLEWGAGAIQKLEQAADKICRELGILGNNAQYVRWIALDIYPRIEAALVSGTLGNIFIPFKEEKTMSSVQFFDGDSMDDRKLLSLINQINDCIYVSDKIYITKQSVHSMRDFADVLNICFWGEECINLFDSLSKMEISLVLAFVRAKPIGWQSESGWELEFMKYIEKSK